jgi:pSer/pThr/pTyr-binding forkhead associated (FHA) protein
MIRVALPDITVEDLGSTTGTMVNGQKIAAKTVLKGGEKLSVGPLHFQVVVERPAPIRKPTETSDDDAAAMLMDGDEPSTPATRSEAAAASAVQDNQEKPKPAASGGHGNAPAAGAAPEEKKSSADAARSLLDKFKKR